LGFEKLVSLDDRLLSAGSDGSTHSLLSFFSRPVIISQGIWSASTVAGAAIVTANLPDDYLSQPLVLQKLKGFLGFRGTAIVKLQINANRFQQGRLILSYFPQANVSADRYNNSQTSRVFQTQLPHVEFDAATDTEVIFEIPYINRELYFNTKSGDGQSGTLSLTVYSPLVAVTSETTVDYTLWVSYKDVKLVYPTFPAGFYPQSARFVSKNKKKKDPSNSEIETRHDGPISSILSVVANTASALTPIPFLTSVAGTVSWAASLAACAASSFGFSNPLNTTPLTIIQQQPLSRVMNASGVDNSYNLGILEDNAIEHLPGFAGVDVDEMSFNHILSIWTYITSVVWQDTFVDDFLLTTIDLMPINLLNGETGGLVPFGTGGVAPLYMPPVFYIGSLFTYYRGSFKIKLKFVKTEFHTGRLLIGFVPGYGSDGTVVNANLDWAHREVVDLRHTSELELTLPYASTRPYLLNNQKYGTLHIRVLNDLRHPDTVSPNVTILIEQACASDFEFAVPQAPQLNPFSGFNGSSPPSSITASIHEVVTSDLTSPFVPQVGNDLSKQTATSAIGDLDMATVGTTRMTTDNHASSALCIGEKIVSIRQLLKRASVFYYTTAGTKSAYISPYVQYIPISYSVTPPPLASFILDYYTYLMPLFGYFRGSMRFKCASADGGSSGLGMISYPTQTTLVQGSTTYAATLTNRAVFQPFATGDVSVYPFPEVQIPYYNSTHVSVNSIEPWTTSLIEGNKPFSYLTVYAPTETASINIRRQIGDDFSAGFFLCTMPLILQNFTSLPVLNPPESTYYP